MPNALISVYKKDKIVEFAKELKNLGWEIISTGGTANVLKEAEVDIIPIEKITGNPECFSGRMKTISFAVEGALLFDRDNPKHLEEAENLKIKPIDLVICNLYPFLEKAQKGENLKEIIEMIDVGGPAMIRAAAKNHSSVAVVVDPEDYSLILDELKNKKEISKEIKNKLASKAFKILVDYDSAIELYFHKVYLNEEVQRLSLRHSLKLRYGENPHQKGYFYQLETNDPLALANFKQIHGKKLSFNNILDLEAVLYALVQLGGEKVACVIVKHNNPCGAAQGENILEVFNKAWEGDIIAAFGGIIGFNRKIEKELAKEILKDKNFFEVLIAPEISKEALEIFQEKKNLILLVNPFLLNPVCSQELDYKKVRGGFLVQEQDNYELKKEKLKVATKTAPGKEELEDLIFAWKICKSSKSNTIILAKNLQLIGSGVGQQDRKRCCELAVSKAFGRTNNGAAASDAFFPFADGPEILISSGIKSIIQPGGSLRDEDVIKLCNRNKVSMLFTGIRCFKH